jgi:copper chaperone
VIVTEFAVEGMTCAHCVTAVTEEITAVPGVTGVEVGLVPGGVSSVRVTGDSSVDDADVRAAVQEAGYEVVGRS